MNRYICILLLFLASVASTQASTRVDTLLTMSDGARLRLAYFLPEGTPPEQGWPAIVSAHGFAGSKNSNAFLATQYADSGYFALTWTIRGQGRGGEASLASEGKFNWFTGERELQDVREILEWLGSRSDVNHNRIGLEGLSQGGLTTWGAAINRLPIRCAISLAAVPHYSESMAHNGCNNYFTATILNLAQTFNQVEMGPFIGDSLNGAYKNDNHAEVLRLLASKEIIQDVSKIEVPVFAQLAWQDDLFGSASLFQAFKDAQAPMKLLIVPGNHGTIAASILAYRLQQSFRYYRYWLKDDMSETIMHPDSIVTFIDGQDSTLHHWGEAKALHVMPGEFGTGNGEVFFFNSGGKLLQTPPTNPVTYSAVYVQNLSNDHAVYRSEALAEPLTIIGAEVSFLASSNAAKWQTNVLLWDRDPETNSARPITRGSWEARNGGAERRVEYQLSPQFYTIPAGHVLEARVKFGMPLTQPADEFGKIPSAPQATALNTFSSPVDAPAYVRLLTPTNISSVPLSNTERTAQQFRLSIASNPVQRGGEIIVNVIGEGHQDLHLELVDSRGNVLVRQDVPSTIVRLSTTTIDAGIYSVVLRSRQAVIDRTSVIIW